jgi:hypothetical protein
MKVMYAVGNVFTTSSYERARYYAAKFSLPLSPFYKEIAKNQATTPVGKRG